MASTNKTTNYELSQFIETDRPAWLTDYNGDMRTIDRIMKAISDMASGASGSVSELADRMSTAEGNISTNTNDIATLDARADSLEAQAQSQAGTIANIQTEQTAQNLGIEAATELGYNLARPYDSASTYAVGAYVLFQNTLYKCITAVSTGEAFDPTKWLAIKATDEISGGGYTLPIASANRLGGVKVGDGLSIDENGALSVPITVVGYDSSQPNKICSVALSTGGSITSGSALLGTNYGYIIGNTKILIMSVDLNSVTSSSSGYNKNCSISITWNDTRFSPTQSEEIYALSVNTRPQTATGTRYIINTASVSPIPDTSGVSALHVTIGNSTQTTTIDNTTVYLSFIYK